MKERKLSRSCFARYMDGISDRRMSPSGLHLEFLRGVLSIVDYEVRSVAQLEHVLVDMVRVTRLLMVAHEGDGRPSCFDPEPERRADVRNLSHDDLRVADDHILIERFFQTDYALEPLDVYRKERRMKDPLEDVVERAAILR